MAEFKESKHPRDEEGKFTYKGGGRQGTEGDKRREAVKKYSDDPGRDMAEMGLKRNPVKANGFVRRDTKSHIKHAQDMGLNQREYERAAIAFFNSNRGKLYYSEKEERYYRFDPKSLIVAICDEDGMIRSFYVSKKGWFDTKKGLTDV
jgi:hypothetical protein